MAPVRHDAIVVLGALVRPGGLPSRALKRRLHHGVRLLGAGLSPRLVLSGGAKNGLPSEASVMRRLAVEMGVSEKRIFQEESAQTTLDNAIACARLFRCNGWSDALIVTDRFHLPRALLLFRLCGIKATAAAPVEIAFESSGRQWVQSAREVPALVWSLLRLLTRLILRKHRPTGIF